MKKTMKKLDYIVKGNGVPTKNFEIRSKKIKRTFEALIDDAEEKADDCRTKAEEILLNIGSDNNTEDMSSTLSEYVDVMMDAEDYDKAKKILEDAKKSLDEDIEVEVEDDEED